MGIEIIAILIEVQKNNEFEDFTLHSGQTISLCSYCIHI